MKLVEYSRISLDVRKVWIKTLQLFLFISFFPPELSNTSHDLHQLLSLYGIYALWQISHLMTTEQSSNEDYKISPKLQTCFFSFFWQKVILAPRKMNSVPTLLKTAHVRFMWTVSKTRKPFQLGESHVILILSCYTKQEGVAVPHHLL